MTKRFRLLTLAAMVLLPLAACDEGNDSVTPSATGSITGTVTVDGVGAAGVVVTLSSGKTATTAATGQYTITEVAAGAYTVTISGAPTDVAFPATTQAAVIATAGQVVTVNFPGSRIRTSAIFASVTSGGGGLAGVTVTLTGPETVVRTTDANGQASAAGLRAGTYTVAISGVPATQTCTSTSQSVAVAAGESKIVAFVCSGSSTARITGIMYIDENNKNDLYDGAALEDALKAANVAITIEGPSIGAVRTVQTDANGAYTTQPTGLAPGSYNVTIASTDPDLPAGFAYGGTSATFTIVLTAGQAGTVNFPFDILQQEIKAYAFLGRDVSPAPAGISTTIPRGVAPVKDVILDLYPTEADAIALTNRLSRDTTNASGEVQFSFLRTAEGSPGGATIPDQIVFAQYVSGPNAEHTLNGESRLEIRFNPRTQSSLAADTFDLLNTRAWMKMRAIGGGSTTGLAGWNTALWLNDTLSTATQSGVTDATGYKVYTDAMAVASLPDTFYMRLSGSQPIGFAFNTTPVANRGTVAGSLLRWIHNGTTANIDTVYVGDIAVSFPKTDIMVRVYHERDDSLPGGPPRYTAGDNLENTDNVQFSLSWRQTGATADSTRTVTAQPLDGVGVFVGVPTNMGPYTFRARSLLTAQQVVLNDTTLTYSAAQIGMDGRTNGTNVCPLANNTPNTLTGQIANCATFAFKYNNGVITGKVKATDSTAAAGLIVTMTPTAGTIQGSTTRSDTTDAGGLFGWTGIREGVYTVSVAGNATWSVTTTARTDTVQNNGDNDILNFIVRRLDTAIKGVVVNDRDQDANVIDPNEALSGVIVQLYRNNSNTSTTAITLDTLVTTTTTDANGGYQFLNLPESRYVVKVLQPGTSIVTRGITSTGSHVDSAVVRTGATTTGEGNNLTKTVGSTTPNPLPRWDFATSSVFFDGRTNFTFLVNTTTARGTVTTAAAAPVPNMQVSLRRCDDSAGATSPPAAGNCTTYFPGSVSINATTDATGTFNFPNLQEGVYEVTPNASSAGFTAVAPVMRLYLLVGPGDIEAGTYTAS